MIENVARGLDKEFAKAQQDPEYRPRFLDVIDLTPIAKYVRGVIYVKNSDETITMGTEPSTRSKFYIPRGRSSIHVFPPAFSPQKHSTVEDFLGTMIDHEGFHAREMFERPSTVLCPVWASMDCCLNQLCAHYGPAEVRAVANVLANPAGREFSPTYLARVQLTQRYLSSVSFDAKKSMSFSDC